MVSPPKDIVLSYSVVIPVYNQLEYTRQCFESLIAGGTSPVNIIIVDNASSDDTQRWLADHPELRSLRNRTNLGCGCAWTQGAVMSHDADWVVLLNNDVLAGPDAIEALLLAAERHGFGVASPALLEGKNDYDFNVFAKEYTGKMSGLVRHGKFHGVCFAIRRETIEKIGFPDTDRTLGGYEDTEYLIRCKHHNIPVGIVGDSVFHHFGSITQKAVSQSTGLKSLGNRKYFRIRIGSRWLPRKIENFKASIALRRWIADEKKRSGFTLHMLRQDGQWAIL
ncbi:MAG: glycosyltransferase family 2 protein [Chlorobiaceae bacterium]|nr:glycosyltransferase family 2 protein [Chlorobiaceae bacterium]